MICYKCGAKNSSADTHCHNCGKKLVTKTHLFISPILYILSIVILAFLYFKFQKESARITNLGFYLGALIQQHQLMYNLVFVVMIIANGLGIYNYTTKKISLQFIQSLISFGIIVVGLIAYFKIIYDVKYHDTPIIMLTMIIPVILNTMSLIINFKYVKEKAK